MSFWKNIYGGQWPLMQIFPELYNLYQLQDATVADLWTGQGSYLHLRRNLNDWEMTMVADFQNFNLTAEKDSLMWKVARKGIFTTRSAYKDLTGTNTQEIGWPWRMIWKTKVPYKVSFLTGY